MNPACRRQLSSLSLLLGVIPALAQAATLYQWTDPSTDASRLGYRPPPGIVGRVVPDKPSEPVDSAATVNCRELQQEQLRLIDQEIARVRSLPAGFGPQYEFTPEARQRFVNDLLAHRSALVTGRSAEEFSPQDNRRQLNSMQDKYQKDKSQLQEALQDQSRQIQEQRRQLERERLENSFYMQRYWILRPGFLY